LFYFHLLSIQVFSYDFIMYPSYTYDRTFKHSDDATIYVMHRIFNVNL